jgi:beta-D-galactosyl-(1->4)-L-rhamnose phosphorylase
VGGIYVLGGDTQVLADGGGSPRLATHAFGRGRAVYLDGFKFSHENTRLLHRALFWAAANEAAWGAWHAENFYTECAWFPKKKKLVVINNAGTPQATKVILGDGKTAKAVELDAHGIAILEV